MALALFELVDVLSILLEGLLEADFDPPQEDNKKEKNASKSSLCIIGFDFVNIIKNNLTAINGFKNKMCSILTRSFATQFCLQFIVVCKQDVSLLWVYYFSEFLS